METHPEGKSQDFIAFGLACELDVTTILTQDTHFMEDEVSVYAKNGSRMIVSRHGLYKTVIEIP